MPWWEREQLLTDKDRQAIQRAIYSRWEDINENWAETEEGRYEVHRITMNKMHFQESLAEML